MGPTYEYVQASGPTIGSGVAWGRIATPVSCVSAPGGMVTLTGPASTVPPPGPTDWKVNSWPTGWPPPVPHAPTSASTPVRASNEPRGRVHLDIDNEAM